MIFALGLESLAFDAGDPRRDFELRRREKDRDEAARDHVENLLLRLAEVLRRVAGRHDRKVIADLRVIEDALVRRTQPVAAPSGRAARGCGSSKRAHDIVCAVPM